MNKIYKVIWSKVRNCYVVVSEIAKNHFRSNRSTVIGTKGKYKGALAAGVMLSVLVMGYSLPAWAADGYAAGGGTALGTGSIAVGDGAKAGSYATIWVKNGVNAADGSAVYYTDGTSASGLANGSYYVNSSGEILLDQDDVSIRYVKGSSIALGSGSKALGSTSIVLGYGSNVSGGRSIALGSYSTASSGYSIALGSGSEASANSSAALGYNSKASGTASIALGYQSKASGINSIALGGVAVEDVGSHITNEASGDYSMAIGASSVASGRKSMALGYQSGASGNVSTALGYGSMANGNNSTALGYASALGDYSIALGSSSNARGDHSVALGFKSIGYGIGSCVIGSNNTIGAMKNGDIDKDKGNNTFVLGSNVVTVANSSVALGYGTTLTEDNVVSVGSESSKRRIINVADGTSVTDVATVGQTVELEAGDNVTVTENGTNSSGQKIYRISVSSTSGPGSDSGVSYDADSNKAKVTLAGADGTVITNVKAGAVSETSTDAVNGSQLYAEQVARVNKDLELTQVIAKEVANRENAVSNLRTELTGYVNGSLENVISYADAAKDRVSFGGANGTLLTNLKDGTVASGSTDAVTGGQLYDEVKARKDAVSDINSRLNVIEVSSNNAVSYDDADKTSISREVLRP